MTTRAPRRAIVFSHANGFPASTYRTLFEVWEGAGHRVHAIEKYGHDPRYPVTAGWPHLARQLRDFVCQLDVGPVYLVGHSLGGYLSLMLAHRHPELARGVVALDSPPLFGWKRAGLGLMKLLGGTDRVMVQARVSAHRTQHWSSHGAVTRHFGAKRKFAAFHPRVLADYVEWGTEPHLDGATRRLAFRRETETAIYRTLPLHLMRELRRRPFRCPVAYVGGTRSKEGRAIGLEGIRRLVGERVSWVEGSHLYPFERPEACAAEVLRWIAAFEAAAPELYNSIPPGSHLAPETWNG